MSVSRAADMSLDKSILSQQYAIQHATKETFETVFDGYTVSRHTETEVLTIHSKFKTFASIVSPVFERTLTLSGYTNDHAHRHIVSSFVYTNKAFELISTLKVPLPYDWRDFKDGVGLKGRFHVCHAEPKLMAFYVDFFKHNRQALDFLGSVYNWDIFTLNINVSREPCEFCQELARRLYEIDGIMVNFTFKGRLFYPRCRNYYCKEQMKDGRRVYCSDCQSELDSGRKIAIVIPQMTTAGLETYITNVERDVSFRSRLIPKILETFLATPGQGLHLCLQGRMSERSLTVIVPHPRTDRARDTIDSSCDSVKEHSGYNWNPGARHLARKAIFALIKQLGIEELTEAYGNFDDFPWANVSSSPAAATNRASVPEEATDLVAPVTDSLKVLEINHNTKVKNSIKSVSSSESERTGTDSGSDIDTHDYNHQANGEKAAKGPSNVSQG